MKPYVAAYLRVSSRNGRQTTDSQRHAIKAYVQTHRLKPVKYFEDKATGRNEQRPAFQTMMDEARQGKLSKIIVWKMDRIGRTAIETIRTIQELMSLSVDIHVITQGLTFDKSPYSMFLIQLFSCLSELESSQISERIRAGLDVARENGVKLGRRNDHKKRAKLIKWQAQGVAVKIQAQRLGISRSAIYAMRQRIAKPNGE
ncbi:recombinase family protein [Candidatus Parcubacteria bacterium]|nr:MAG: recombinase family protein [Candidatus Parcubacteria bacterium]